MKLVVLVTALALVEYLVFGILVERARAQYGVSAPAVTGDPIFERYHRVHQNMLEGLVVFLPSLWLFATYVSEPVAALLGAVFIAGRAVYARLYILEPSRRGVGVGIHFSATVILLLGGTLGALLS
jgi:glutathione S-transferase